MLQRIGFIFITSLLISGCQNISTEDLEALNARADKAEQLQNQTEQLQAENTKLKQEQTSLMQTVSQLNNQLEQEIENKNIIIEQNKETGIIKVTLQQDVLFPSGSYKLNRVKANAILKKVASSLDGVNKLRIVGHTDNMPVSKKWREQFTDNWDLSARRAGEVARYFIWGFGFPAENIEVVGRAHVNPVASNDDAKGRALNRRIELFITK